MLDAYSFCAIIFFLGLGGMFIAHLASLGTPFVKREYHHGVAVYSVWVRRLFGYNHLVSTFETEEDAHILKGKIIEFPPGIL